MKKTFIFFLIFFGFLQFMYLPQFDRLFADTFVESKVGDNLDIIIRRRKIDGQFKYELVIHAITFDSNDKPIRQLKYDILPKLTAQEKTDLLAILTKVISYFKADNGL